MNCSVITTTGFDVHCRACGFASYVEAGLLERLMPAHRALTVTAIHAVVDGTPTTWVCTRPRALR